MTAPYVAGWIVGIAMIVAGALFLVAPRRLSPAYGVRADDSAASGYARATGIRDIALGVAVCATAYFHDLALLAVLAGCGIAISIADFVIAYRHGHRRLHAVHGIHASGVVAFILVLAMVLFAIPH